MGVWGSRVWQEREKQKPVPRPAFQIMDPSLDSRRAVLRSRARSFALRSEASRPRQALPSRHPGNLLARIPTFPILLRKSGGARSRIRSLRDDGIGVRDDSIGALRDDRTKEQLFVPTLRVQVLGKDHREYEIKREDEKRRESRFSRSC